jgi:ComF family protein
LRDALLSLKYKNNIGLAQYLSSELIHVFQSTGWEIDFISPIPLSKSHSRDRGYNQAQLLAYPLSLGLQVPMVTNAVTRIKETAKQVDLSREERFKNVEDAFYGNPAKLLNKKVLLVDDIVTTGATLRSCSKAMLQAGCESIFCLTVARTIK